MADSTVAPSPLCLNPQLTAAETELLASKRATPSVRVALYARVSTLNGQDPEMQLRELREYASRRGWVVDKEYIDRGARARKNHDLP
jgi:hypothetical protein